MSGRAKGADPETPPDPKLVRHRNVLDVSDEQFAKWRAMRIAREDEHGQRMTDDELVEQLTQEPSGDGTSRPCAHAVTTCRVCKMSTLVAGGMEVPLTEAARERLLCDSEEVGDLESEEIVAVKPNIPYPTRRRVFIRDRFACVVPGCRSCRNLALHHVEFRSSGGTHAMSNLVTLCSGHHTHLHDGLLAIRGVAPDQLVFEFCRAGDDEPHRVLTSAPVTFELLDDGRLGPTWDERSELVMIGAP